MQSIPGGSGQIIDKNITHFLFAARKGLSSLLRSDQNEG
jgi:hypothetical protein